MADDETGLRQDHEFVFHEVTNRAQGLAYLDELVCHVERAREAMDKAQLAQTQQKAFHNLLIRYGRSLGALTTLMHTRVLQNEDYDRYAPRIHGAIVPKVVTAVGG